MGKHAGCFVSIELALGRSTIWLACRYDAYEIHVKHLADNINGAATFRRMPYVYAFKKNSTILNKILQKFSISSSKLSGVKRMADFIAFYYTHAFLRSRLWTCSPAGFIHFLSFMKLYRTLHIHRPLKFASSPYYVKYNYSTYGILLKN